jgi:hypothetical protein
MTRRHLWGILGVLAGIYLIGLVVLAGMISERLGFNSVRTSIVRQLDDATRRSRAHAMAREQGTPRVTPPAATSATEVADRPITWTTYIEVMDTVLVRGEIGSAERAWREAHAAAVRTRAWRPLLEVGAAAVRISAVDGRRGTYIARARELYMAALLRARADRSVDGVLQVAEAFYILGDHRVVEQCLMIAENLGASTEGDAIGRLRALSYQPLDARAAPRVEP